MGSKVGKVLGSVLPIAAAFIPGVGPLAAAAIGAGGGLLSGGGLKGAALGGVTGGLGAGLGSSLASGIAGSLGTTLSEAAAKGLGGALTGATAGLASGGGLKGAALGAGLGGAGGYALGGGLNGTALGRAIGSAADGIGDTLVGRAVSSAGSSLGDLLGTSAGSTLDRVSGVAGAQGPTQGSGLMGALTNGGSGVTSGGGFSSYAVPILGAANSLYSNQQAQDKLKEATNAANDQLNPYLESGKAANEKLAGFLGTNGQEATADEILAASPGYQFAQQQGEQALARKNAASGGAFSGAALKDAATFNQGLSQQAANDYYAKLAQQAGTGLNAAGTYGGNTTSMGSASANANIQTGNTIGQLLSGISKRFIGYDANNRPVYA